MELKFTVNTNDLEKDSKIAEKLIRLFCEMGQQSRSPQSTPEVDSPIGTNQSPIVDRSPIATDYLTLADSQPTIEEIRAGVRLLSEQKGKEEARKFLQKLGATSVSAIKKEQYSLALNLLRSGCDA